MILAVLVLIAGFSAHASTIYAVSSNPSKPSTFGAPDGAFVQFADNEVVTFDFGSTTTGPSVLQVFTFDDIAPASAKIEVSVDNSTFSLLSSTVFDTNGTVQPGPVYPSSDFVVGQLFRYVRVTDNADGSARNLGFDLDALGVGTHCIEEFVACEGIVVALKDFLSEERG